MSDDLLSDADIHYKRFLRARLVRNFLVVLFSCWVFEGIWKRLFGRRLLRGLRFG